MRDGTLLRGNLYLPAGDPAPAPCIVTMTPYGADAHHERARYFAENGLNYLVVDVRGRGNSDGVFRPLIQEADDGYDIVQWAAELPECDGQVAMKGGSYSGYCQWATASRKPPALRTIVPIASPYIGVDFPMRRNIFAPYILRWLAYVEAKTPQAQLFADEGFWSRLFYDWHVSGRPFAELDRMLGREHPLFQEWLQHPEPDDYWDAHNPTHDQYAAIDVPVLTITGHYDDDQLGALEHHRRHLEAGGKDHFVLIGPWDHAGTGAPPEQTGGLVLGEASRIDIQRLHLDWYRWTMLGGERPELLERPITYYVMGAERWQHTDAFGGISEASLVLHLDSDGTANSLDTPGVLGERPGEGPPDCFEHDTGLLDGPAAQAELLADGASLFDQSLHAALDGQLLVYQTAPFESEIVIAGRFALSAWIAIDSPDADFYVTISEVQHDGSVLRLSTDLMRARYRTDARRPYLVTTREPLHYDFDQFTFVARTIAAGSRLRLTIAPGGHVVDATFAERNFGGGGSVAAEAAAVGGPVTVNLYHDAAHPSMLHVPVDAA
jgi:putative CocE/NonD family hydrolase